MFREVKRKLKCCWSAEIKRALKWDDQHTAKKVECSVENTLDNWRILLLSIEKYSRNLAKNYSCVSKILLLSGKKILQSFENAHGIMFQKLLKPAWKIIPNIIRKLLSYSNMECYTCVLTCDYYPLGLSQIEKYFVHLWVMFFLQFRVICFRI